MTKRITYPVISYGEWARPRLENFREQCCDCGLIHRLDFRIVDGRIEFRTPATIAQPPRHDRRSSSPGTNDSGGAGRRGCQPPI